jgi:hypothetical protein
MMLRLAQVADPDAKAERIVGSHPLEQLDDARRTVRCSDGRVVVVDLLRNPRKAFACDQFRPRIAS